MDQHLFAGVGTSLINGAVDVAAKHAENALRAQGSTRFASLLTSGFNAGVVMAIVRPSTSQ